MILALSPETNTLLIAIIGALGTVIAAAIVVAAPLILKRLGQIHVLVNSNMDALKEQVEQLETDIRLVTGQRDAAENVAAAAGVAAVATEDAVGLLRPPPGREPARRLGRGAERHRERHDPPEERPAEE